MSLTFCHCQSYVRCCRERSAIASWSCTSTSFRPPSLRRSCTTAARSRCHTARSSSQSCSSCRSVTVGPDVCVQCTKLISCSINPKCSCFLNFLWQTMCTFDLSDAPARHWRLRWQAGFHHAARPLQVGGAIQPRIGGDQREVLRLGPAARRQRSAVVLFSSVLTVCQIISPHE